MEKTFFPSILSSSYFFFPRFWFGIFRFSIFSFFLRKQNMLRNIGRIRAKLTGKGGGRLRSKPAICIFLEPSDLFFFLFFLAYSIFYRHYVILFKNEIHETFQRRCRGPRNIFDGGTLLKIPSISDSPC